MAEPFPTNPNYQSVVQALLQMHQLSVEGQFESPQADAIRDAMNTPWQEMSESERQRLRGLSDDLNATREISPLQSRPMNRKMTEKLAEISEIHQRGEWDLALEQLRRWGPSIPPAPVAHLRGQIWLAAGDPQAAAVFFDHACQLEPDNHEYQAALQNASSP